MHRSDGWFETISRLFGGGIMRALSGFTRHGKLMILSVTLFALPGLVALETPLNHDIQRSIHSPVMKGLTEKKSASTIAWNSGTSTWDSLSNRHIAGIKFQMVATTGATESVGDHVTAINEVRGIFVEEGTELGISGTTLESITLSGPVHVRGGNPDDDAYFVVQTSDSGAIESGRHLIYWLRTVVTTFYDNASPSTVTTWTQYGYTLVKLSCADASVTTRKTYGQPNLAGELPADANAPLRNVKFGSWEYRGGLFAGNMPTLARDHSGTARMDFFPSGGSSYNSACTLAALSLFDQGKPTVSGVSGAIDLGLYTSTIPSGVTESNVTWDTQCSMTPGAVDTGSTNYNIHPYDHLTLTDGNSDDYIVIQAPTNNLEALVLALVDESSYSSSTLWHYFAAKEYQSGSTFPRSDCAPRVWLITVYP